MEMSEAVAKAKSYLLELFSDEQVVNLGFEEVEHDHDRGSWAVTLSFSRPWNTPRTRAQEVMESLGGVSALRRSFKIVKIADDGSFISVKNRPVSDASE